MHGDGMLTVDDILMPLATAVIIDNKVKKPELTAFQAQANELLELFKLEPMDAAASAEWFDTHSKAIKEKLSGPRRNTFVLRILSKFSEDIHVENIFDAMVQISLSDKEYRREESDLIKSAASLWGYDRPPVKVTE